MSFMSTSAHETAVGCFQSRSHPKLICSAALPAKELPTAARNFADEGQRSPDTNIAVQRDATANADRTLQLGNPSHNFGLIRRSRAARASLSQWMCYHFLPVCSPSPDQVRLSNVAK